MSVQSEPDDYFARQQQRRYELIAALTSRPLTVGELAEVGCEGYYLIVPVRTPFNASEKQREFAALLAIQQCIQLAAKPAQSAGAVDPQADSTGKLTTREGSSSRSSDFAPSEAETK